MSTSKSASAEFHHDQSLGAGALSSLHAAILALDVDDIGGEPVAVLIGSSFEALQNEQLKHSKQLAQSALDICWEKLNSGYWRDVSITWRQLYSFSAVAMSLCLASEGDCKEALKSCDVGLLMGAPIADHCLQRLALYLSQQLRDKTEIDFPVPEAKVVCPVEFQCHGLAVERVECPSLAAFEKNFMRKQVPVIMTGAISHWPAMSLRRWSSSYLKKVAGNRTVPVEVGARYTDQAWSQKLMTIGSFVDLISAAPSDTDKSSTLYLAQHQLFEQLPELRADICVPDYCCLSESEDEEPVVNAWIGPRGTVSPLHHDPYHNIFSQVVGKKVIRLYSPAYNEMLYPHESPMLHNTSQVDCDDADLSRFPKFAEAPFWECVVEPGELLYIPPKFWHFVRSLSVSFSVSFWWT